VWSEVVSAQIVTGTYNYVLRVSARDLGHYSDFLIHRLHRVSGVMTESNIVLATVKDCGFMLDIVAFPARESLLAFEQRPQIFRELDVNAPLRA
jgi:Lrp/AsnC family transcriptional regulator, leucine-responsive regulatory protein